MLSIVREDDLTQVDRHAIQEEINQWESEGRPKFFRKYLSWELERREGDLQAHGFRGDADYIYFIDKIDALGYKTALTEELYQAILRAIKKAAPAKRELAKRAGWSPFGGRSVTWSSPSLIVEAAALAEVDVRVIVEELSKADGDGSGTGSNDDGIIYVLRHSSMAVVKIGRTKRQSADRAANYAVAHDDPGAWLLHHEVATKNVAKVETRVHARLASRLAQYGHGSKEVFAVSPPVALQAVYAEVEL